MAISNANRTKINKMNRVAKDTTLGTVIQTLQTDLDTAESAIDVLETYVGTSGSVLVTTAMMSASRIPIINASCNKGKIWQYMRSGSYVTTVGEAAWVKGSGCLVLSAFSGSLLPNDQVYYMMW